MRALTVGACAALFLFAGQASAHSATTSDDHGLIDVVVDDSTDPCMGTVHLSELDFQNGTVEKWIFLAGLPPDQLLEAKEFNGSQAEGGFMASVSGFELREGFEYYFVADFDTEEHHSLRSQDIVIDHGDCGDPEDEECFEIDLEGTANGDGSITLTAHGLEPSEEAELWRHGVGESAEEIATLTGDEPTFHDTDTEVGTTYTYSIFVDGDQCVIIQVTSVPVFPTAMAGVFASVIGIGAYMAVRRRS